MADLTYDVVHLGNGRDALKELIGQDNSSKQQSSRRYCSGAGRFDGPMMALRCLAHVMALADEAGAKLMILHTAASRVGAMEIGFANEAGMDGLADAEVIYNLGADEIDIAAGPFVIYQGSHGDRGAHRADVILPGAAYTEQSGLFVNTEGRPQMASRAGFPPGEAKEDWAIIRALSAQLDATQPWNDLAGLRSALFG